MGYCMNRMLQVKVGGGGVNGLLYEQNASGKSGGGG